MAENRDDAQERNEKPTAKRLEDARQKGQIPRSRELSMAAVMIAGALLLLVTSPQLGRQVMELMRMGLTHDQSALRDGQAMIDAFGDLALRALLLFTPFLAACAVMAVLGSIAIGGWMVSAQPLAPKLDKLDPVKGLKRVFGLNGLVEVVKAIAKAGLIGGVALLFLSWAAGDLLALTRRPVESAVAGSMTLVIWMLVLCSGALALIALLDAPYQMWNHQRQLKMTRRDIRDEMKETEGRPEVKSRIRQLQQEMSQRRMLKDLPNADVIVTNPSHFAVALRYDETRMRAPVVVAKGVDHMAARIREVGREHRIAVFEAPPLARALYWTTEIGHPIPASLYLAVAQVLTYVLQLRRANQGQGRWPERPQVSVDPALAAGPAGRRGGTINRSDAG